MFAHLYFSSAPAESGTAEQRHSPGFFTPSEISHFHKSPKIKAASLSLFFSCPPLLPFFLLPKLLYESIVAGCDAWNNVPALLFGLVSDGERRRWETNLLQCFGGSFPPLFISSPCTIFYDQFIHSVFTSRTDFQCFSGARSWSVDSPAAPPAFASPLNKTRKHDTTQRAER